MNLLAKVATVAAAVVVLTVVAYLCVILAVWRKLKHLRRQRQGYTKELSQLELAHESILQVIGLIEDNIAKHGEDNEMRFQEKKLAEMRKALEKNERKALAVRDQLEKYQAKVKECEEALRCLRTLAWLKSTKL